MARATSTARNSKAKAQPKPKPTKVARKSAAKQDRTESEDEDDEREEKMGKHYDSDALDEDSEEENISKQKPKASTPKKVATTKLTPAKKPQRKADREKPQKKGQDNTAQHARKAKARGKSTSHDDESPYEEKGNDEDDEDEDVQEYNSDALDDSDDNTTKKRKRPAPTAKPRSKASPRKRQRKNQEEDDEGEELDLKEGQEIVGVVVQAPKTGRVPPGRISQNTFDFLENLRDPKCNDREWFKLHEPVYRLAEQEWKDFIEALTMRLTDVDSQVPPLPPKDVIHRIYRDIRFSNDKTPYKKGLSASFSRSGRKGIFAGLKPGGESLIAAGSWCPGRNELATIRANIQRNSRRLRNVISSPKFVRFFGEPRPRKDGGRQNVFGMEDELKVAPKGVDKGHKDIDLLKCRSFAVVHKFTDSEVLDPNFVEIVSDMVGVMRPLVHCLNDMMTVTRGSDESDEVDFEDVPEYEEDERASVEV
ncbi:hypothetical protein BDZ94DRAFT_1298705 [Collybia nuda]|uniref:Uncharacterized protein n=1 Tax=Collybia nuda TaxID=64659 RepID=A0A9P6CHF4_9AGAR|nr:hypothetical protein BDZ94DRAFT_1298705 [Collybia nuda]